MREPAHRDLVPRASSAAVMHRAQIREHFRRRGNAVHSHGNAPA